MTFREIPFGICENRSTQRNSIWRAASFACRKYAQRKTWVFTNFRGEGDSKKRFTNLYYKIECFGLRRTGPRGNKRLKYHDASALNEYPNLPFSTNPRWKSITCQIGVRVWINFEFNWKKEKKNVVGRITQQYTRASYLLLLLLIRATYRMTFIVKQFPRVISTRRYARYLKSE